MTLRGKDSHLKKILIMCGIRLSMLPVIRFRFFCRKKWMWIHPIMKTVNISLWKFTTKKQRAWLKRMMEDGLLFRFRKKFTAKSFRADVLILLNHFANSLFRALFLSAQLRLNHLQLRRQRMPQAEQVKNSRPIYKVYLIRFPCGRGLPRSMPKFHRQERMLLEK